jgi:transposase InsO family protein
MRENGIKVIRTQKYKATTDSNHTFNIAPNLLDQDFTADGPNQKWAGDISYIWTSEGWLYESPRVYWRVKLSKDEPHGTEKITPEVHG